MQDKSEQDFHYQYFTDSELLMLFEHSIPIQDNEGRLNEQIMDVIQKIVSLILPAQLIQEHEPIDPNRIYTFDHTDGEPQFRSILVLTIPDIDHKREWRTEGDHHINGNDGRVLEICQRLLLNQDEGDSEGSLLKLNQKIPLSNSDKNYIIFRGVCPNWLMSSSQTHVTSGGPGGLPTTPTQPIEDGDEKFYLNLPLGDLFTRIDHSSPLPVEIVVLDTAPTKENFNDCESMFRDNTLWQSLCRNVNDTFFRYYPSQHRLSELEHYDIYNHKYNMSDHGLFIAGIIHNIAPKANIHLVQVLNKYGVGTIETLAVGLKTILEASTSHFKLLHRIIINCSLTIAFNFKDKQEAHNAIYDKTNNQFQFNEDDWHKIIIEWIRLIEWLIDTVHLNQKQNLVFAAAGNEGSKEKGHPPALYPAAYRPIIGVGTNEEYSNLADFPIGDGVYTRGGKMNTSGIGKEDEVALALRTHGILSLYLQPKGYQTIDTKVKNDTGWIIWSGTSFATAIASGILAMLCEIRGSTPQETWKALQDYVRDSSETGTYIEVIQGHTRKLLNK